MNAPGKWHDTLEAAIVRAFGDLPPSPAWQELASAHEVSTAIAAVLQNKKWTEIASHTAIQNHWMLEYLNDEVFCYYLPAFLCAVARDYEAAREVAATLVSVLGDLESSLEYLVGESQHFDEVVRTAGAELPPLRDVLAQFTPELRQRLRLRRLARLHWLSREQLLALLEWFEWLDEAHGGDLGRGRIEEAAAEVRRELARRPAT